MVDVIDSVIDANADEVLAGSTSMHDLMVAPRPLRKPVRDLIVVRAPGSLRPAGRGGHVRIEHLSSTGYDEVVERPSADAVALFWRFVIEKYGIEPPHRSE
ncbi:hypothetical protein [Kribbella sp. NPDC051770]|uniref:hypothetical protein n=1 Tax=Kribbella sp. NPDC051770 TaxID=3155413 RepID=UPI003438DB6A